MKNTTVFPIPQPPPDNNKSSLTIRWEDRESFPSCSTLAFAWNNNSTSNWDSFTPVLFSDDDSKENKSTKILEWPDVAVLENQYSLTLPQIIDQEQRASYYFVVDPGLSNVHLELWCSNNDNSNPKTVKTLCGKSPQFTLFQPLNHPTSTITITNVPTETYEATTTHCGPTTGIPTGTHETTTKPRYPVQTTGVFDSSATFTTAGTNIKKRIIASSSQPKPSSPITKTTKTNKKTVVAQSTSHSNGQGTPTTIAKTTLPTKTLLLPKATTTHSTVECLENIPNPSCLPILPSIIAPNLSYNSPSSISTSSSSSTTKTTTTTTDNTTLNNSESYQAGTTAMDGGVIAVIVIVCATVFALGLYLLHVRQQRSRGDYSDGERLRGGGVHRRDDDPETGSRRSSMSSLTTYGRFRSYRVTPPWSLTYGGDCGSREDEQSYGRTYPQVPPVHISPPVLVGDPAVHRQRQHQQHQQRAAALNMDTTQMQTAGGSGSSQLSPVSVTSSRCRGLPSVSTRYPATAPGGGVATVASAAHALQPRTALHPASSVPSSLASNESEFSPTHAWSPFSGRTSPFHRKLTTISSRSSPSRSSSVFSKLSDLSSVYPLPMDKEQDRRVRKEFEAHIVELPKPASLMRTHISTPIRSIMSISSEEGHVLARQDVLIRMEDDADDYDSDMEVREHQLKKSTNRYSKRIRTPNSRDTFHIRHSSDHNYTHHLPSQLNSSTPTSSRQGLRHHQHHQHQQPLHSPHRNSLARTSYCSSIVPLTPKIPQQYISSSSAESCLSRGSSAVRSLSRPIGYDPEWIDATEGDGNYDSDYDSDYNRHNEWQKNDHGRTEESEEAGRKGSEMSKPISRSIMKAVRHERSRVSPALPPSKTSEWARERERKSAVAVNKGGSAVVEGGLEERHRHVGVEYY